MTSKPRRANAFAALGKTMLGGLGRGPGVSARVAAVPRWISATMRGRYPGTSPGRLALLAGGILYILSPVDLMPELVLTVFGLGDDVLVATWLAGTVLAETESFLEWEKGVAPEATRPSRGRPPRQPSSAPFAGAVIDGEIVSEQRT